MKRAWQTAIGAAAFSSLALIAPHFVLAQEQPAERIFQASKAGVEKAIERLRPTAGGRLPILDGFVDTTEPLDRYSRGYYQCSAQVSAAASGGTLVRVTAKITAWYAGTGAEQAGYRVLLSNGRLEGDFLDRLGDALGSGSSGGSPGSEPVPQRRAEAPVQSPSNSAAESVRTPAVPASPPAAENSPGISRAGTLRGSQPPGLNRSAANAPASSPAGSEASGLAANNGDLNSLRERREKEEAREKDLGTQVENLEEIQRNQAHPSDLVVVKRPETPVLDRPSAEAHILFHADAQDEFQLIEKEKNWVHVQISGESRGWIRRADVDLPDAFAPAPAAASEPPDAAPFRISREETSSFPGNWQPLHGKTVKIVWAEPASGGATSADAKRVFAKSVFLKSYQEVLSENPPLDGVVIVFDAADGGQISATRETLRDWQAGTLSDAAFWKQCALDPPELLQDSAPRAGVSQ